jgi:hypothetical protein
MLQGGTHVFPLDASTSPSYCLVSPPERVIA